MSENNRELNEDFINHLVKKQIKEVPTNDFYLDMVLGNTSGDKWGNLERDLHSCLKPLIQKYSSEFGKDSYAVIDVIYQVLDEMFQKT